MIQEGPKACPSPCWECSDGTSAHHWIENGFDPDDPDEDEERSLVFAYDQMHGTEHSLAHWACKHCPAWKEYL